MQYFLACDKPLPCVPGTSPFRIKGEFYRNIGETMGHVEKKAPGMLQPALKALGVDSFANQPFLASTFYDVLPLPRMSMAIAHALGRDLHEFTTRMGTKGAELQITGVYKAIFATMTPKNFAQRFGQVIAYLYDFGPVEITSTGPLSATLVRRAMPLCVVEWWNVVSVPYVSVPLEHNGAKNMRATWEIEETGAKDGVPLADTTWQLSWQE